MYKTCLNCNKLVSNIGGAELCKHCEIQLLSKLKNYIEQHPNNNIMDVSLGTNISLPILNYLISRDRLSLSNLNKCTICGLIIDKKENYCSTCKTKILLKKEIEAKNDVINKPKMHYLGRKR